MEKADVTKRLKDFGYEYKEDADGHALEFAISKASWSVLNDTNCDEIPEGLMNIAIDMACGEFLQLQKGFGKLTGIEFERVAKSISEGDTSVTFSEGATPEQKFDAAVGHLLTGHKGEFVRYRKLVW